jgi:hypothetical protein
MILTSVDAKVKGDASATAPAEDALKSPARAGEKPILRWVHYIVMMSLAMSLFTQTGCGLSEPDWYYHFICNGDQDCLETNPTGQPSGNLNEGPDKINCTQLMVFADHFWGPGAKNWCDQEELPGGGATFTLSYDANGSTGGTVPVDMTHYAFLQSVTVQGNPGNLTSGTFTFRGWNSKADGSAAKTWIQGGTFQLVEDVTLFATFSH